MVQGCAATAGRPTSPAAIAHIPAIGSVPAQQAKALPRVTPDGARIHALQDQLAERDRRIAAVHTELDAAHAGAAANEHRSSAPQAPAQPASAETVQPAPAAALEPSSDGTQPGPPAPPPAAAIPTPEAATAEQRLAAADPRVAVAERRIVKLQQQLALEVKRRQDVEAEMTRLLQETSAGPYDHADNVVEKHLREELDRARKEVNELRGTLLTERRERAEIEKRFAALQAQANAAAVSADPHGVPSEEVEALKERQRRVLASIAQDLQASQQRETELRETLARSQGSDGPAIADQVTALRSENSALQARLEDEHQHNRDLSAKLQVATRVTDLIFKMRTAGTQPPGPVPAAAR
jgi:hypothetical protein